MTAMQPERQPLQPVLQNVKVHNKVNEKLGSGPDATASVLDAPRKLCREKNVFSKKVELIYLSAQLIGPS